MTWFAGRTLAWLVVAAVLPATPLALAQPAATASGKVGDIELSSPVRIGAITLEPGFYRLQHREENGRHVVVVKKRAAVRNNTGFYGTGDGAEVAQVPCEVVSLDEKLWNTALYSRKQPDGTLDITQIRIRGERSGHLVTLQPKTP